VKFPHLPTATPVNDLAVARVADIFGSTEVMHRSKLISECRTVRVARGRYWTNSKKKLRHRVWTGETSVPCFGEASMVPRVWFGAGRDDVPPTLR
jgi:hypothetical protein